MHIRAYLFMMAAGILIPVILFSGIALNMLQNAERDAALGALSETANSIALRVEREMYSAEAALKVLAASPSLARRDYAAFYDEAKVTNRDQLIWSVLLDKDGQQLINTSVSFGEKLPSSMTPEGARAVTFIRASRVRALGVADVQADGELIGELPMTFEIVNDGLEVFVP